MDYDELVAKVIELLKREKRIPYRSLKRRFELDDDYIEDLKIDLIEAKRLASAEHDRILVWLGASGAAEKPPPSPTPSTPEPVAASATDHERDPLSYTPKYLAEKILTSRSALEGERKQVTVLFCDLANSTPIAERLGPEHMHTLLNRFFELALDAVHRYEGTINQFLGDGFMALFGAPIAHEDHARRAVLAALALQRTLQEAHLGEPYAVECTFRMGLNSGLVVVGSIDDNLRMDYSAIGDTTNLAARLQQVAEPGTMLVSESTTRLVQGTVRLEALTPVEVKGKTEPVSIYKVIGTLPRRSPIASRSERTLSPFVGRKRELATLEALFAQIEAGQGQVVGIVAEAGGGKSRLLYECRQRLQDKRVTYLEGRCLSYGSSIPYHPLIDVLRYNCGISETESPEAIVVKHHALPVHLERMVVHKAEGNPFFLEELTRAVTEHGDLQEDMAIPDTIQGVLMARIDRLPEDHKRVLQTASVLGRAFSPRLLEAMGEGTSSLQPLLAELQRLEFLYERTGADEPLFVFKHALTQEVAYESLLTTRRQVLHGAAGHAMERLYPDWLAEHYEALAHHFTQGTVWEKAFDYLTKSGDKARQAYANQEAIAFYTQALEVSQRITPAVDDARLLPVYEGRGRVWQLLSQYDAAIADWQQMRDLAHRAGQQRQEGESLCYLASAHHMKMTYEHLLLEERCAQEAMDLAHQTGDQNILAQSLARLGQVQQVRGDLQAADRHLGASLQISQREGYTDVLAPTLRILSAQAYWQGCFQRAIHLGQDSVTVSRDTQNDSSELPCLAFLCLAVWSAGHYAQAFTVWGEGMQKAKERDGRFIIGRLTNTQGWFHRELGALSPAVESDQESIEWGRTTGIANVKCSALINLGFDYLALGQHARALSYFAPTLDRVEREAFGHHRWRWKMKLCLGLAEVSYMTGEYDQALRYVDEGLQEAQRTSSQKYVALGWALRGKIIAKLGDADVAGTELQRAFTLADQLQSPSLLYPIAYDLGYQYETTGKEHEAASLYGKAKATIEQMATAVEDEALRSTFLQSALVQEIHERAARLGG
jgi:class 3 adenylate cyclase/tetratricopeptide (TPR) repeat protein